VRFSIKYKLAAAILSTSVAATLATGIATQYGFSRSFLDYLTEQGVGRLEVVAPKVAALYERSGSWEFLRTNPRSWFETLGLPGGPGPATPVEFPAGDASFTPDTIDVSGVGWRIALTDAQGHFLIGFPTFPRDAPHRAVVFSGRTVGWLYLAPLKEVSNVAERRFQRRQLALIWLIGALAVIAAALIAVALAHTFLTPIQDIARAARELAAGRLSVRVVPGSRDEIGQLAVDVNQLAQSMEKHEGQRRDFMADISHEFRTPLAVMRAELEAIEDGVRQASSESIHSLLAEVGALNKLVDDVHDLAIADLGALSYRRSTINVGEVLQTCVSAFQARFAQRRLQSQLRIASTPLLVFADEGRLQQLFNNLLENSARHTDAGGAVEISAAGANDDAVIRIEDSTPGVPPAVLPRLFERFFRVDASRSRSTGGSGLGLAICRGIVEAHGGTIAASQSGLGGVRIEVRLPLAHLAGQAT
jgi:two-component system sensor histidine kinase BaeS